MTEKLIPELRFPEFDGEWEEKKLGELGRVLSCRRIYERETSAEGDVPFYKIGTFGRGADAYIKKELFNNYKIKYPYPKKGDILISASGTIGRLVEYSGEDAYYQDSNIVWLDIEKNDLLINPYLKLYYQTINWNRLEGSTIKRLYNKDLLSLQIFLPPLKEQDKIGKFFSKINKKIELQSQRIDKLKEYKKGIIQRIFSQEIRFKDENGNDYPEWEEKKLGEIVSRTKGKVVKTDEYGKYPVIAIEYFNSGKISNYTNDLDRVFARKNDVLLLWDGSHAGDIFTGIEGVVGSTIMRLRPKDVNNKFLVYFISQDEPYIKSIREGSGIPHIPKDFLKYYKVNLPVEEEQEKIANFLSSMDQKIQLEEEKLELQKEFKKGLMQRMFI